MAEAETAPVTPPAAPPNGTAKAAPPAKAGDAAPAKPTEVEREREEARRANDAARKSARERDELATKLKAAEDSIAKRDAEREAARKLAREDPAKAMQAELGITYAEATRILIAKGKGATTRAATDAGLPPAVAEQIAELKKKLDDRDKRDEEREAGAKARHDAEQTERVYVRVTDYAGKGENADKYELTLHEAKADPVRYRALFRRYVDAEVAEGRDPTEADVLEAFEEELLTREKKRASLKKLRGIYSGPGSAPEQPAAKKGTAAISDGPRTLTQEQTAERASGTPPTLSAAALADAEESARLDRAAEALRRARQK